MDDLSKIAKAYYEAGTLEFKSAVQELFGELDSNGDGGIELFELTSIMPDEESIDIDYSCQILFSDLDTDHNGKLDFWEFMTFYYIKMTGRPFCKGCGIFIPGTYFTCVHCHADPVTPRFDLCITCYEKRRWSGHNHPGKPAQFMDNYALFDQAKRSSTSPHNASAAPATYPNTTASTSNTIVTAPPPNTYAKPMLVLQMAQTALAALAAGTSCTIL